MKGQLYFIKIEPSAEKKLKRKWENAFQKRSDREAQDGTTPLGKCGYGLICDYCTENDKGRPCVRALNSMLREKGGKIDYNKMGEKYFENIFQGGHNEICNVKYKTKVV